MKLYKIREPWKSFLKLQWAVNSLFLEPKITRGDIFCVVEDPALPKGTIAIGGKLFYVKDEGEDEA